MGNTVLVERRRTTAIVTFRRPDVHNALRPQDVALVRRTIEELPIDVRAVVLTGSGGAFCAGSQVPAGAGPLGYWRMLQQWKRLVALARTGRVVTIAAVNGLAVCGGFELLLACDFVVLSSDAHVLDQHVKFGLHPGAGTTVTLPRRIGSQRALWHLLGAEPLTPQRMVDWGLALEVCSPDNLLERAVAIGDVVAQRVEGTARSVRACVQRSPSRWAPLAERLACLRNTRRLGAAGAEAREQRFAENGEIVAAIRAGRAPRAGERP